MLAPKTIVSLVFNTIVIMFFFRTKMFKEIVKMIVGVFKKKD